MTTLTDFLLARIAEDEAVAREAIPGTYAPNADADGSWRMIEVDHEGIWPEPCSKPAAEWGHLADEPWAVHVERHDPARVLAECDAKRRIMEAAVHADAFEGGGAVIVMFDGYPRDGIWPVLGALALPYADHPDYDEAWRP